MPYIAFVQLSDFTPLPNATSLKIASQPKNHCIIDSIEKAKELILHDKDLRILVCNAPVEELFSLASTQTESIHTVLVTDLPMAGYSTQLSGREDILVRHVVANRPESDWTIHDLRITLQKIIQNDVFGISKYLTPNTQIISSVITGSNDRDTNNKCVMDYAASHNLGQHICRSIFGISEELLMNAIYDAPVAGGKSRYNELPRSTTINLEAAEYSVLKYGFDGSIFAISVTDPFGAFQRDKLYQYVKKVLLRRDSDHLIDNKKGGAGLGIFKILYSSHGFICNIEMGQRTEIISLIDVHHTLRDFSKMTRSIHYFEQTA